MKRWNQLITLFVALALIAGFALAVAGGRAFAQGSNEDKHKAEVSGAVEVAKSFIELDAPGKGNKSGFGHNQKVNQDLSDFPQDETAIMVNPVNPKNLVAGANDYRLGYGQSGFYASQDGGKTWVDGIIPIPSWPDGDVPDGGGDPVVLFDTNGTAYYVGLAFERANARSALVMSRSTNGGLTWSRPSFATGDGVVVANLSTTDFSVFHDKEWAAIDLSSGQAHSFTNRIYVTWTRFDTTGSPIYEAHSDNGGRTWSAAKSINGSSTLCDYLTGGTTVRSCVDNQPSWPVVGPDGTVYVFFRNLDTVAENQFLMVKSSDGGVSFSAPVKVADVFDINYPLAGGSGPGRRPDCTARGQSSGRSVLSNSCFRVNSYGGPGVAADGSLYLVWSDNRNGDNVNTDTDIFIVKSTDGGATWSAPMRVNNDPVGNDKDQWFPWMAVDANGVVYVVFHDRRLDSSSTMTVYNVPINPAGNYLVDTWMARSMNGGMTWENFRVTDQASNFDFGFRGGIFLGDYSGLAVTTKMAYPFFTDARNGTDAVRQSDVYIDLVQPGTN